MRRFHPFDCDCHTCRPRPVGARRVRAVLIALWLGAVAATVGAIAAHPSVWETRP